MVGTQHLSLKKKVKTIINKEISPHLVQGLILGIEFVFLALMKVTKVIIAFLVLLFTFSAVSAEKAVSIDTLPPVFLIGEHEFEYESQVKKCDKLLLEVCQDSMQLAYKHWLLMLHDMEIYADAEDFDIKGIKIWLNVFWDEAGTIDNIVFYPKPNSRNADFTDLTAFFEKFMLQYEFPLNYQSCFSHYGSATFPTFAKLYLQEQP